MQLKLPSQIIEAINALENEGYRAFIAGSSVRELMTGGNPVDYDIITNGSISDIEYVFRQYRTNRERISRGELLVVIKGYTVLVAPYRAVVIGNNVTYTDDLLLDLKRRGFAMNSMAYNHKKGLVDSFYGESCISQGSATVSAIFASRAEGFEINENHCFTQAPINLLKAVRYVSEKGYMVEERTMALIKENLNALEYASSIEIRTELSRILCGRNANHAFELFPFLMKKVIPDIEGMIGFDVISGMDFYSRIGLALSSVPPILALRFALIFRYSGLRDCVSVDYRGKKHYYGFIERSRLLAKSSIHSLGFDNALINNVDFLIENMDVVLKADRVLIKKQMAQFGAEELKWLCYCNYAEAKSVKNTKMQNTARKCLDEIDDILNKNECYDFPMMAISAEDLVRERIIEEISSHNLHKTLLEMVISHPSMNTKIILLEFARKIVKDNRKFKKSN